MKVLLKILLTGVYWKKSPATLARPVIWLTVQMMLTLHVPQALHSHNKSGFAYESVFSKKPILVLL